LESHWREEQYTKTVQLKNLGLILLFWIFTCIYIYIILYKLQYPFRILYWFIVLCLTSYYPASY
jgi:hypothetical protein